MKVLHNNIVLLMVLAGFVVMMPSSVLAQLTPKDVVHTKATYLYKILQFTDREKGIPIKSKDVVTLGVLGTNDVGDALKVVDGKRIKDRFLTVKYFKRNATFDELKQCDLLLFTDALNRKDICGRENQSS